MKLNIIRLWARLFCLSLTFGLSSRLFSSEQKIYFGQNFQWCVATSGHQIEGDNFASDWWQWEQIPGHIKNGDFSGRAAGHSELWKKDLELLQALHVSTYRMGVEWSKIMPMQGVVNWVEVARYKAELAAYEMAGIKVMLTLSHFTLPLWVKRLGGWEWEGIDQAFAAYTEIVATHLGATVDYWITLNEPMVLLLAGYQAGVFPPGYKRELKHLTTPLVGMLKAHASSYHRLKSILGANVQVGVAHHLRVFDPFHKLNPLDSAAALISDKSFNWTFPQAIQTGVLKMNIPGQVKIKLKIPYLKGTQDFFGLNYYSRDRVKFLIAGKDPFSFRPTPGASTSDLNWEIYPKGIYRLLKDVAKKFEQMPIYITENGVADANDIQRLEFIHAHLKFIHRAQKEGVPVQGYCHWSLMDNFEWAEGFWPRFGLYHVDYITLTRTARPSALVFANWALENAIPYSLGAIPIVY